MRWCGEPVGEHIGNLGNIVGPIQNLKGKKSRHFECMLSHPIGCMKILFPKLCDIFGLG